MIYDVDRPFYFRPVSKIFITAFPFFNRALQCLPSFRNFLKERSFEKVKNGRSSGGLLATKKEGYRFSATPVNAHSYVLPDLDADTFPILQSSMRNQSVSQLFSEIKILSSRRIEIILSVRPRMMN